MTHKLVPQNDFSNNDSNTKILQIEDAYAKKFLENVMQVKVQGVSLRFSLERERETEGGAKVKGDFPGEVSMEAE